MEWQAKPGVDFWSEARMLNHTSLVMISPELQEEFEGYLIDSNYTWKIAEDNVERLIQNFEKSRQKPIHKVGGGFNFFDYQRSETINSYLRTLAKMYPKYVTVKDEGRSFEQRVIKSVRITDGSYFDEKVTMVIECGIHAREWIAPTFCMYLIEQLTVYRGQNLDLLKNIDWFIVPLLNPDGYEYTHTKDRLWRKTRKPDTVNSACVGVDGNRNFDFEWGDEGTSDDPCSEIFKGREPFSEPETRIMGNLIKAEAKANPNRVAYLSFHSFGYWLLYPYGYSLTAPEPPSLDKLKMATDNVVKAVHEQTGSSYEAGNSAELLYAAAGAGDDFAMGAAGIELAMTVEMPPRSDGYEGFMLPSENIISVCMETMIVVRELGKFMVDNYLP
ncbi:carboxypeptidase B-like [Ctenocephalides felis]|uniref:carboxypeptidase B-like n=1 Tax=Ctenocephalides felis TaxID=7515 RepID=UPI000E6E43D7|nr:carboxypeptidase B-like [Ctenocephalides felis]